MPSFSPSITAATVSVHPPSISHYHLASLGPLKGISSGGQVRSGAEEWGCGPGQVF